MEEPEKRIEDLERAIEHFDKRLNELQEQIEKIRLAVLRFASDEMVRIDMKAVHDLLE